MSMDCQYIMDNLEEIFLELSDFERKKKYDDDIPKILEDYLCYVARTGDVIFPWLKVKPLFKCKLDNVLQEFNEFTPPDTIPPCPNVDHFDYHSMRERLLEQVDTFSGAPFTIQRLCELITSPRKHYQRSDKFMRGVEKNILIVSTIESRRRFNDSMANGEIDTELDVMSSSSPYQSQIPSQVITNDKLMEMEFDPASDDLSSDFAVADSTTNLPATLHSGSTKSVHLSIDTSTVSMAQDVIPTDIILTGATVNIDPSDVVEGEQHHDDSCLQNLNDGKTESQLIEVQPDLDVNGNFNPLVLIQSDMGANSVVSEGIELGADLRELSVLVTKQVTDSSSFMSTLISTGSIESVSSIRIDSVSDNALPVEELAGSSLPEESGLSSTEESKVVIDLPSESDSGSCIPQADVLSQGRDVPFEIQSCKAEQQIISESENLDDESSTCSAWLTAPAAEVQDSASPSSDSGCQEKIEADTSSELLPCDTANTPADIEDGCDSTLDDNCSSGDPADSITTSAIAEDPNKCAGTTSDNESSDGVKETHLVNDVDISGGATVEVDAVLAANAEEIELPKSTSGKVDESEHKPAADFRDADLAPVETVTEAANDT